MVQATDNVLSNAFAVLSDGWPEGDLVEGPLHGDQFRVTDGEVVQAPADCLIAVYATKVWQDQVVVLFPSTV